MKYESDILGGLREIDTLLYEARIGEKDVVEIKKINHLRISIGSLIYSLDPPDEHDMPNYH